MTELLELEADDRVLEIGTGSGYQAAVLGEICDEVYTIEIIPELARSAAARLEALDYDTVVATQGDGYYGWAEHIHLTMPSSSLPLPIISLSR